MTTSRTLIAGTFAALSLATAAAAAPASNGPSLAPGDCFNTRDWAGWKSPSADILYLNVRNDVYRVDLIGGGQRLDGPGKLIISQTRGVDRVCSSIDLDIRLGDTAGFSTPLFPTGITKLTAEQVAALPPADRP